MTTKVENNDKNRHQLADHIVDSMDLKDLIQIVYDDLMAYYEKDTEGFEQDWNDYDLEEADA
tara:strand:- start:275 stop:460 length:186 start_codon:yes stop_codon:yes gene_type:complete